MAVLLALLVHWLFTFQNLWLLNTNKYDLVCIGLESLFLNSAFELLANDFLLKKGNLLKGKIVWAGGIRHMLSALGGM